MNGKVTFSAEEKWLAHITGIPVNECSYWKSMAVLFVNRSFGITDQRNVIIKMKELYKNSHKGKRA